MIEKAISTAAKSTVKAVGDAAKAVHDHVLTPIAKAAEDLGKAALKCGVNPPKCVVDIATGIFDCIKGTVNDVANLNVGPLKILNCLMPGCAKEMAGTLKSCITNPSGCKVELKTSGSCLPSLAISETGTIGYLSYAVEANPVAEIGVALDGGLLVGVDAFDISFQGTLSRQGEGAKTYESSKSFTTPLKKLKSKLIMAGKVPLLFTISTNIVVEVGYRFPISGSASISASFNGKVNIPAAKLGVGSYKSELPGSPSLSELTSTVEFDGSGEISGSMYKSWTTIPRFCQWSPNHYIWPFHGRSDCSKLR